MKRILASASVLIAAGAVLVLSLGSSNGQPGNTYKVELNNSFGLVNGADFKVAGAIAGSIKSIDLCKFTKGAHCTYPLDSVVTVSVNKKGFGTFHQDAFCQSRPQSLIGEYFVDCDPGTSGPVIPPGSTIKVAHTQSTIPADLVQDIMRLPYRQRFSILINELGAAVAARSEDLQTALRRADPALTETDNLLALLANDAYTIRDLNANADTVITALARNSKGVQNFIVQADKLSTASATQAPNIQRTWEKLPAFLTQLRLGMLRLGQAADAQDPVLNNLNQAANNLQVFFHELVPFSHQSAVSLGCGENGAPGCPGGGLSLGTASKTGKPAVIAARPLATHLNTFTQHTPELAQNLAITLHALDDRGYALETDPRSPDGGRGYTGLEALLQYAFNQTLAIDYFSQYGHLLAVDAFANQVCSPYTTPQMLANDLAQYQQHQTSTNPRSCYAFLGPNQPGVTTPDPSWNRANATAANPSPCVPDPGGYPQYPGYQTNYYGEKTNACKLQPNYGPSAPPGLGGLPIGSGGSGSPGGTGLPSVPGTPLRKALPPINLNASLSQILSGSPTGTTAQAGTPNTSSATSAPGSTTSAAGSTTSTTGSAQPSNGSSGLSAGQTQQLLNYLLAP